MTDETCNGLDDDCDDVVDNGCICTPGASQPCYEGPPATRGVGVCRDGLQECPTGMSWGSCVGEVDPGPETCNAIDDDCDGVIDNGCGCASGASRSCYSGPAATAGIGTCHAGVQTCSAGSWGACVGEVLPSRETCNTTDDDCDGSTNERDLRIELSELTQTECAGGWEIVSWSGIGGTELPRSAQGGVFVYTLPGSYACVGTLAFSAYCPSSAAWRTWASWTGGTAEVAGVRSLLLEGDELADTALVCNYFPSCLYGAPSYWTSPRIPLDITLAGACDVSPQTCPDWCDGDDYPDPLCH